jgi:hypothetical protein
MHFDSSRLRLDSLSDRDEGCLASGEPSAAELIEEISCITNLFTYFRFFILIGFDVCE